MTALNREAKALLREARGLGEPADDAVARVRASLIVRAGIAAAVATAGSTAGTAAAAPVVLAAPSLLAKVLVLTALVGGGVTAGYAYHARTSRPPPQVAPAVVSAPKGPAPTGPARLVESARTAPAPGALESAEAPPRVALAPGPTRARDPRSAGEPILHHETAPEPDVALAGDISQLRAAQAALVAGDPQRALDAAARARASGPLAVEREAVLRLADCALDRAGARAQARDFVRRHEGSPLALRVAAACRADAADFATNRPGGEH